MAHFQPPPDGEFGEYDVDSKLAVGSIWRMTSDVEGRGCEVALWGGSGLSVRSNNPTVVANPLPERASGAFRVLRLKGLSPGTTMLEAGPSGGAPWVSLQVRVVQKLEGGGNGDSLIELTSPHMALNAANTPVPYDMRYDRRISAGTSAANVIATATAMGKLKHLVISSHGYIKPGPAGGIEDSVIDIGAGLSKHNIELFSLLKPAIGGGVIWFGACGIGNDNLRNGERASRSGAFIVAPVMYMAPKRGQGKLPAGKIDMYQRFVPKVFAPTGYLVSWPSFLRMDNVLGFRVT